MSIKADGIRCFLYYDNDYLYSIKNPFIVNKLKKNNSKDIYLLDCEYIENDQDAQDLARNIKSGYRGMGSFGDFVLYTNGEYIPEPAEEFDRLHTKLFDICIDIITKPPIEIAKNLLSRHIDINTIAIATGLSIAEIQQLKDKTWSS